MSRAKTWRRHADSLAETRIELFPGSVPLPDAVAVCPRHGERLGSLSNMCWSCFEAAWEWTAAQLGTLSPPPLAEAEPSASEPETLLEALAEDDRRS